MKFVTAKDYKGSRAWEALLIANMDGTSTRLHWTDKPYEWHVNDGEEVFVVLDGAVDMHCRQPGDESETVVRMNVGDIFYASIGTEHVACPVGEARVLVVETADSI